MIEFYLNEKRENKNNFITIVCKRMFESNWKNFPTRKNSIFIFLFVFEELNIVARTNECIRKNQRILLNIFAKIIFHFKTFQIVFRLKEKKYYIKENLLFK